MNKKNLNIKKIFLLSLIGRGGTYHTTVQISSSLANHCETHLLVPTYSDTNQISKKVRITCIVAPPSAFKTILLSLNILGHINTIKKINSVNPDVIDILDIHPWYVLYWPFLKAKKKIVTINDPELHSGEAGAITKWILNKITKFILIRADIIVVLGKKQEEIIRKLGYTQKIIISKIGNYGFLTKNHPEIKPDPKTPKTMLFFGRVREYKGLSYLLDALIGLKKDDEDFRLIIAGDGDLISYQAQLEKLKGKVEIYNKFVADDSVAQFFVRASFVVLPYTDATQTGIIPVAYAFKKAVIVTDVGSLPEFVVEGKTGMIINPKDVKALKKAVKILLKNPQRTKTMGISGYDYMKKELDWNRITNKLLKDLE